MAHPHLSCIQFTLSLQRHHDVPLTRAYSIATKQFVQLRAAHELATQAAEAEARAHGASFTADPWVSHSSPIMPPSNPAAKALQSRSMEKEREYLDALAPASNDSTASSSRVKYRKPPSYAWTQTVPPTSLPRGGFSGGKQYVGRWRLPPPVESETAPAGDLLSAIGGTGEGIPESTQSEAQVEEQVMVRT